MTFTRWIFYALISLLAIFGVSIFVAQGIGRATDTAIVSAVVASPSGLVDGERPFLYVADVRRTLGVSIPAPLPETTNQVMWYGNEGKMLIFTAQQIGQDSTHGLHLFDPRSGDVTTLYTERVADASRVGFHSYRLTFFEDRWLAFLGVEEHAVYVTDLTTGDTRRIYTYGEANDLYSIVWSPDGTRLAVYLGNGELNVFDVGTWKHRSGVINAQAREDFYIIWTAEDYITGTGLAEVEDALVLVDATSLEVIASYTLASTSVLNSLRLDYCGSLQVTYIEDARLHILNLLTGETIQPSIPALADRNLLGAAPSCEGILVSADQSDSNYPADIILLSSDGETTYQILDDISMIFTQDGNLYYMKTLGFRHDVLHRVVLDGASEPVRLGRVSTGRDGVEVFQLSPIDDEYIVVPTIDNRLVVGELDTENLTHITPEGLRVLNWHLLR